MEKPVPEKQEILKRIQSAKRTLGKDLVILAHYYQNDDIVASADFIGDSLQLARMASKQHDARSIVFCAVSFMAEMAKILCSPGKQVFHPEPQARCPLAEMASIQQVQQAWESLQKTGAKIIPVVYVNSEADLKAFCGRNGGFVCTSANAQKAMQHVLSQGEIPFFFPDENLGRNTAASIGIPDSEMMVWGPAFVKQDAAPDISHIKTILWKGFCYVHTTFRPAHVENIKRQYEGIKIIVHPECTADVVRLSDFVGSTSYIKSLIEESEPGSKWAVGTEFNFVKRLMRENPTKMVVPLTECACREMSRMTTIHLMTILEALVEKSPLHEVQVDPEISKYARVALDRMLEIG